MVSDVTSLTIQLFSTQKTFLFVSFCSSLCTLQTKYFSLWSSKVNLHPFLPFKPRRNNIHSANKIAVTPFRVTTVNVCHQNYSYQQLKWIILSIKAWASGANETVRKLKLFGWDASFCHVRSQPIYDDTFYCYPPPQAHSVLIFYQFKFRSSSSYWYYNIVQAPVPYLHNCNHPVKVTVMCGLERRHNCDLHGLFCVKVSLVSDTVWYSTPSRLLLESTIFIIGGSQFTVSNCISLIHSRLSSAEPRGEKNKSSTTVEYSLSPKHAFYLLAATLHFPCELMLVSSRRSLWWPGRIFQCFPACYGLWIRNHTDVSCPIRW